MSSEIQVLILGLSLGGVYALMASGLTLVFGVMRIVNLAHPVFILIASYISYLLFTELGVDPIVSVAVNMPVMFLFGVALYRTLLGRDASNPRYTEITVLLTFAIALMAEGILGYIFTGTNRSVRPSYTTEIVLIQDFYVPKAQLYASIMSLILIGLLWAFLQFTRLGYAIRATTQNRTAAQTVGVNVEQTSTISFGIGTALAGGAGSLMSFLFSFYPNGHWQWVAILLSLIVLGGMGRLAGAVVSAFLLAVASSFVASEIGFTWAPMTFFLTLFLILLIRPQGLFGKRVETQKSILKTKPQTLVGVAAFLGIAYALYLLWVDNQESVRFNQDTVRPIYTLLALISGMLSVGIFGILAVVQLAPEKRFRLDQIRLSVRREHVLLTLVAALFLFPVWQLVTDYNYNFYLHMLLLMFMYVTMATSWNIIGGYTGYVSLGHNVFWAVGAYFSGVLLVYHNIPVFASAPVAGLVALGLGFLVGLITLRVRGPAFIISTIALVMVFRIGLDNWEYVGGTKGMSLPLLDLPVQQNKFPYYYAMLIIAILSIFTSYYIRHSKMGLALRAISQDEIKAESAGIPTSYYKILAFAISGFYVGIAGAIWAQYLTYMRPNIFLIIFTGAQLVLMSILGGKGTVAGPVIGAIVIINANEFFLSQFGSSELNIFGTGLIMVAVLVFFPEGIVGSLRSMGRLPAILDWD